MERIALNVVMEGLAKRLHRFSEKPIHLPNERAMPLGV
jgi:hypothetical protein